MAWAGEKVLNTSINVTVVLAFLLLPASGVAGAPSKSPVAFERFEGKDRPLYAHPNLAAFHNPRKGALPETVGISRDPESGIVIYKTAATEKTVLKSALGKQGFVEIPAYATADGRWVVPTDQIIVQFRKNAARPEINAFLAAHKANVVRARRNHPNQFVVKISDPAAAMNMALTWHQSELVDWAQANCIREARPRFIPNDTLFSQQWYLHNTNQSGGVLNRDIGAERAWDITRGDTNVIVAVLDDGFELTHPDIAGNVFSNSAELVNALDDDLNGYTNDYWGWDFWDNDNDPSPTDISDNHGMATAGLIIAQTDNGLGVAGLANFCKLLPIRVYSTNVVKDINWADSVEYAAQFADVISISYFIDPLPANYDAIRYAVTSGRGGKGCVVCAAYGNEGVFRRYIADLATAPEVLGVSGNSNYDKRSWFGDYGPSLSVVGPAGGGSIRIVSTDRMGVNGYDPTDYVTNGLQGTSFSCPLAAGVAALVISEHPTWSGLAVRRQIESTCDKIDAEAFSYNSRGRNEQYGYGRLNAWAALTTPPAPRDYEPDGAAATASPIEDGEMQHRSLSTGADEDWVSFSITNISDFRLTIVGTTNAGLKLYDSNSVLIATNTSGSPSYCYLVATNQSAATYYACAFSPPGVAISNYGLHFGILNLKDGYEPDNLLANAKAITPRAMQYHTLNPGSEEDWVTFTLPRTAAVKIWTMGEIGGDTEIWLKDSGGTTLVYNDDGPANRYYSYISNLLAASTYYVQVKEFASNALPSYQILLEVYDLDDYETNNTPAEATPVTSGERLSCTIFPSGDEDWFSFSVSTQANVLLLTDTQNPYWWDGDTVLTLFDSQTNQIAQNDDGNNYTYSAIFITNLAAGAYYAMVAGWGGSIDPDYYLSLDIYSSETQLTAIQSATNGVGITWTGDASFDYQVGIFSNDTWNATTNLEGRVGENRWIDPVIGTMRWYRVVVP